MAKRDYYPRSAIGRRRFLDQFAGRLPEAVKVLGVPDAEASAVAAAVAELETLNQAMIQARQEAIASTSAYHAHDLALEQRVRLLVQRLKTSAGYDAALGVQLGVEAPPDQRTLVRQDAIAQQARPSLRLVHPEPGRTVLAFEKNGFDGIELSCAQGSDPSQAFQLVGRFTRSPATDSRPNIGAGPETRRYRACYLRADQAVGQMSDTLNVTIQEALTNETR